MRLNSMFNKKLTKRIEALEEKLGIIYTTDAHDSWYQDLDGGFMVRVNKLLDKAGLKKKMPWD